MYDVIVVGARCAGASTAMLLARKGHRVLLERVPRILNARCGRPSWCSIVMI